MRLTNKMFLLFLMLLSIGDAYQVFRFQRFFKMSFSLLGPSFNFRVHTKMERSSKIHDGNHKWKNRSVEYTEMSLKGVLIDISGTLIVGNEAIPNSICALNR